MPTRSPAVDDDSCAKCWELNAPGSARRRRSALASAAAAVNTVQCRHGPTVRSAPPAGLSASGRDANHDAWRARMRGSAPSTRARVVHQPHVGAAGVERKLSHDHQHPGATARRAHHPLLRGRTGDLRWGHDVLHPLRSSARTCPDARTGARTRTGTCPYARTGTRTGTHTRTCTCTCPHARTFTRARTGARTRSRRRCRVLSQGQRAHRSIQR